MALSLLAHRWYCGLMGPVAGWSRKRRMQQMARRMALDRGAKVLDLGGQPAIWRDAPGALCITVLNLPGIEMTPEPAAHEFSYVEGDACHVQDLGDDNYDMVFSNSVIEHVGGQEQQAAFAHEVRRLGKSYWVQTPAIWFPIEAHTGLPFWWFYPEPMRARILRRWRDTLPEWADSVRETRVLTRQRLQALFPEAQIYVETVLGVPKSYTAWYAAAPQAGQRAH